MDRYISDEVPLRPIGCWAKVALTPEKGNPEKKLVWGYVDAAYILALRLDKYREELSEDNICTNYGCELVPAVFRICKKAISLAMSFFFDNQMVSSFRYGTYTSGWNTIKSKLELDDLNELDELVETLDTVNENDLIRDGDTRFVNYVALCEDTRRMVAIVLTRAQ